MQIVVVVDNTMVITSFNNTEINMVYTDQVDKVG